MTERNAVLDAVRQSHPVSALATALPQPSEERVLGGAIGSLQAAVIASLHRAAPARVFVAVTETPRAATSLQSDLDALLGDENASRSYPQIESLPYEDAESHVEIDGLRVEAIEALFGGRAKVLVTTARALQERAPIPLGLAQLRTTLRVGESHLFGDVLGVLEERGFDRVALVEEVGQYAIRGGIIDVFSVSASDPVRIEFWGDDIVSIRLFDIMSQRATREVQETHILPVHFRPRDAGGGVVNRSLLELLPSDSIAVWVGDVDERLEFDRAWDRVSELYSSLVHSGAAPPSPDTLFMPPADVESALEGIGRVRLLDKPEGDWVLDSEPPPDIDRDMAKLDAWLRRGEESGVQTLLLCDNSGQLDRLEEILGGVQRLPYGTTLGLGALASGFQVEGPYGLLRVLNDHEIFRRARRVRRSRRFRGSVALESLAQLTPGAYVVHMDHGVGRFRGLEQITIGKQDLEVLAIEYAGGEVLRVPVGKLDLIERWVGETDDAKPRSVHRIGGKRWKTLKRKTETVIEEMTTELLELYARRQSAVGFQYSPDTRWQMEMESSFLYEDTPDQRQATTDVKKDMESPRPMDRLVCGDVGYGKTEVAIRAAFKAAQDGKQVAVLAPTTILAEQHRHTFEERLADYPVTVGSLSRFRSAAEQAELLVKIAAGSVDIVIGTHRLLSKDVDFKELGLLIVDEEQRFGVKHKERLKQMRAEIDVLTLSATPIPRTLYLSMSGIRDLSLIRTPPRDRMPIFTSVTPWTDQLLSEALHRELDRGGQSFFLHNRIDTIYTIAEELQTLIPEAKIDVAHGQMGGTKLDRVMTQFVDGEIDILVCSSIIENGLDVPNANTLIVDRADRFGLSQLYQIRGRVGRSDRRAYCYLLVPDGVGEDAERRLRVLEHYTELGSGYAVALRDLELRGAGNLLGADQSGFAQQVGLDAYMRMLRKAVERIQKGDQQVEWPEPDVSLDGPSYLPDSYVPDSSQKLHLYRRLSKATTRTEVEDLKEELSDRYGKVPIEVSRLLDATVVRVLGRQIGLERALIRESSARLSFRSGVMPRLSAIDGAMKQRQVFLEVVRHDPFSIKVGSEGLEPVLETVLVLLAGLTSAKRSAA